MKKKKAIKLCYAWFSWKWSKLCVFGRNDGIFLKEYSCEYVGELRQKLLELLEEQSFCLSRGVYGGDKKWIAKDKKNIEELKWLYNYFCDLVIKENLNT